MEKANGDQRLAAGGSSATCGGSSGGCSGGLGPTRPAAAPAVHGGARSTVRRLTPNSEFWKEYRNGGDPPTEIDFLGQWDSSSSSVQPADSAEEEAANTLLDLAQNARNAAVAEQEMQMPRADQLELPADHVADPVAPEPEQPVIPDMAAGADAVPAPSSAQQQQQVLEFEDTGRLFTGEPSTALVRTLAALQLMSAGPLVDVGLAALRSPAVAASPVVQAAARATAYKHFCAGETADEAAARVQRLWRGGMGGILDYGIEDAEDGAACDRNVAGFLAAVAVAMNCLQHLLK